MVLVELVKWVWKLQTDYNRFTMYAIISQQKGFWTVLELCVIVIHTSFYLLLQIFFIKKV